MRCRALGSFALPFNPLLAPTALPLLQAVIWSVVRPRVPSATAIPCPCLLSALLKLFMLLNRRSGQSPTSD